MKSPIDESKERYRQYPNNPKDKPEWHYNRDIHVGKKRHAFVSGALWMKEEIKKQIEEALKDGYRGCCGKELSDEAVKQWRECFFKQIAP